MPVCPQNIRDDNVTIQISSHKSIEKLVTNTPYSNYKQHLSTLLHNQKQNLTAASFEGYKPQKEQLPTNHLHQDAVPQVQ